MKPFIVINCKTYLEALGERAVKLARDVHEVQNDTGVRIVVCPQYVDLESVQEVLKELFAQHIDASTPGMGTGSVTAEAVKIAGAKGTLINHSEKMVPFEAIAKTVARCEDMRLESLVCTRNAAESAHVAKLKPDYIAVEPPDLIGSGRSVSRVKPELISASVEAVKKVARIPVLCGAGITNDEDVARAIELGSDGVLVASAVVKAKDPRKVIADLARAL